MKYPNFKYRHSLGKELPDPFFDYYMEEHNLCCDILNMIDVMHTKENITLTFNKHFLNKIVKSHILFIKKMRAC